MTYERNSRGTLRNARDVAVSALRDERDLPFDHWKRRDILAAALASIVGMADSRLNEHTVIYPDLQPKTQEAPNV